MSERKRETAVADRAASISGAGGAGVGGGGVSGLGGGGRGWFFGHGSVVGRGVVSEATSAAADWDANQGMAATWPWTERGFVKNAKRVVFDMAEALEDNPVLCIPLALPMVGLMYLAMSAGGGDLAAEKED